MITLTPVVQIVLGPISEPGLVPLTHPTIDVFLLGLNAGMAFAASLVFLQFWRETRDSLFLAFAGFFGLTAVTEGILLTLPHPNEGSVSLFLVRLIAISLILAAILKKNSAKS